MAKWKFGYHVPETKPHTVVHRSPGGVVTLVAEVGEHHEAEWIAAACEEKANRIEKGRRLIAAVKALRVAGSAKGA